MSKQMQEVRSTPSFSIGSPHLTIRCEDERVRI